MALVEIKLRRGRHDSIDHDLRDGYNAGFSVLFGHLRLPVSDVGSTAVLSFPPASLKDLIFFTVVFPMTSSRQTSLPQEIFDNVIDHFHADTQALQTCALVALAWLSSARAHLFHCISLEPPKTTHGAGASFFFIQSRTSPCQKLFDIIEWSTKGRLGGIMPYVRELHLCEGMLAREWLAHEPTLPLLLRSLPNLRRFEISRSASVRIAWGQLPIGLKAAIAEHVLCLPALTELRLSGLMLDNVGDLGELLRACGHLRVLEVDHVIFANESVASLKTSVGSKAHRTQLDKLVIGPRTSTALISFLLHPHSNIAIGTMRELAMSISGNFADFARLLHASLSVEHLELSLMNDGALHLLKILRSGFSESSL